MMGNMVLRTEGRIAGRPWTLKMRNMTRLRVGEPLTLYKVNISEHRNMYGCVVEQHVCSITFWYDYGKACSFHYTWCAIIQIQLYLFVFVLGCVLRDLHQVHQIFILSLVLYIFSLISLLGACLHRHLIIWAIAYYLSVHIFSWHIDLPKGLHLKEFETCWTVG